jgi:hypothetical protein
MKSVLDATAKKIMICTRSKRWWKADIKERRRTVGTERKRRWNPEETTLVKEEVQMLTAQSKRTM